VGQHFRIGLENRGLHLFVLTKMYRKSLTYSLHGFSERDMQFFERSEIAYAKVNISVKQCVKGQTPTCKVFKSTSKQLAALYPPSVVNSKLSLTDRGKSPMEIHLCAENWNRIPKHLGSDYENLDDYRVALISHEFAHVLGHDHVSCACVGCPADVRSQPSRSYEGCAIPKKDAVVFNKQSPHTDRNF
jgi:hypothetical protein